MSDGREKTPTERLQAALPDLRRPLILAARRDFAALPRMEGLERRMASLLSPLESFAYPKLIADKLERLSALFSGFQDAPDKDRKTRILAALATIDSLEIRQPQEETGAPAASRPDRRPLDMSVQFLKGVGPRVAQLLAGKNLLTIEDLLFFLPRRYEDHRRMGKIAGLVPGEYGQSQGIVAAVSAPVLRFRKRPYEMMVQDDTGICQLTWFHYAGRTMTAKLAVGQRVRFGGKVGLFRGRKQIVHPDVEPLEGDEELVPGPPIHAVYPEIQGITKRRLAAIVQAAAARYTALIDDPLPPELLQAEGLPALGDAVRFLHNPDAEADVEALNAGKSPQQTRLAFDELFFVQLALAQKRQGVKAAPSVAHKRLNSLATRFYRNFPHKLTEAQKRVLLEIVDDLTSPKPMNRLLQGDVGSGKTIVAILSALLVIENGRQAALMAPTEILAEQHYKTFLSLCDFPEVHAELLTSDLRRAEKRAICEGIESGEVNFAVGTHALIQEGVAFRDLGYVIVDEQHRFGVSQRLALQQKGRRPDCLVMTATPIPRSLSLTLYGDLDVSIIDELPAGRQPIETCVLWMSERAAMERELERHLAAGRQAYVITPLISESDKLDAADAESEHAALTSRFSDRRVGLLHGRLSVAEKETVMRDFRDGAYDILVATSVVEVGVDVPNATVMAVQHAERFGLSQLHQLRGRIGRGQHPSVCFLMCEKVGENARERLSILEQTTDGFRIAEKDLELRGPGDFMGTRQVGEPVFLHANLVRDYDLLLRARCVAQAILERDPALSHAEHLRLQAELKTRWEEKLGFLGIG
ncbi:MAG: ATP-dependent DNA helicase RecG [Myxococcales bacterium]|nr:MAG: ATP-dependent DNA helicase RecG [Myxococcales bacterium]